MRTKRPVGWDPVQYGRFADERARPFRDLLAVLETPAPGSVLDLGCGPGTQTAELAARWPTARVVGVDNSEAMLAAAKPLEIPGRLGFVLADLRTYAPAEPVDVVVTNATLQWVPGHLGLLGRMASFLSPGGLLALQVPGNFREPTHLLLRSLAASDKWRPHLAGRLDPWPSSHDPADYLEALESAGLSATAWETTYLQVLRGEDAVLEWMKGTALRPVLGALGALGALGPEPAAAFLADYRAALGAFYPERPDGSTLLPYRRVFAVGKLPGDRVGVRKKRDGSGSGDESGQNRAVSSPDRVGATRVGTPAVAGLDHAQLAMPAGREDEARSFYAGLLGLVEEPKPPALAARGGCWFRGASTRVHLGVEDDFRPARKAHVGLAVLGLDALAQRLEAAGRPVRWDEELAPRRRFFTEDPFGNRVELLEPED